MGSRLSLDKLPSLEGYTPANVIYNLLISQNITK